MNNIQTRYDQLIAALQLHQYRLTPQRMELVRMIAASEGHPSANLLFESVHKKFPTMSRATVYKTLSLLKDIGQVFEIDLREDSHYDGNRPEPHPHLVCVQCGKILDGDVGLDADWLNQMERSTGFVITRPQITLYGLCPACNAKSV
ncbi:MAG TPA: transcriptional repressor [Anaerolineales bacterium]|nr:transcriptional repressor [Anaerolineales bacterium]